MSYSSDLVDPRHASRLLCEVDNDGYNLVVVAKKGFGARQNVRLDYGKCFLTNEKPAGFHIVVPATHLTELDVSLHDQDADLDLEEQVYMCYGARRSLASLVTPTRSNAAFQLAFDARGAFLIVVDAAVYKDARLTFLNAGDLVHWTPLCCERMAKQTDLKRAATPTPSRSRKKQRVQPVADYMRDVLDMTQEPSIPPTQSDFTNVLMDCVQGAYVAHNNKAGLQERLKRGQKRLKCHEDKVRAVQENIAETEKLLAAADAAEQRFVVAVSQIRTACKLVAAAKNNQIANVAAAGDDSSDFGDENE